MSGSFFFDNTETGGIDTGFFSPDGIPTLLNGPFNGVLANSNAVIGGVTVINEDVAPIPVKIVASDVALGGSGSGSGGTSFDGVLSAGSAHIGQVSLDAPVSLANGSTVAISGTVPVSGSVTANVAFPSVQNVAITGTPTVALASNSVAATIQGTPSVSVSNWPTTPGFDGQLRQGNTAVSAVNPLPVSNPGAIVFADATAQVIAANATFTGSTRTSPANGGVFVVRAIASGVISTCYIEASQDGTTWTIAKYAPSSLLGTSFPGTVFSVDAVATFYRVVLVNTTGSKTITIQSYFSPLPSVDAGLTIAATLTNPVPIQIVQGATPVTDSNPLPGFSRYNVIYYADSTTVLGASAVFTGSARDTGVAAGLINSPYTNFLVTAVADQAGMVRIEQSANGTTWYRASVDTTVPAATPVTLSVAALNRYWRVVFTNGGTAQGSFCLTSGFSRVGALT